MMHPDPTQRPTPEEARNHPFLVEALLSADEAKAVLKKVLGGVTTPEDPAIAAAKANAQPGLKPDDAAAPKVDRERSESRQSVLDELKATPAFERARQQDADADARERAARRDRAAKMLESAKKILAPLSQIKDELKKDPSEFDRSHLLGLLDQIHNPLRGSEGLGSKIIENYAAWDKELEKAEYMVALPGRDMVIFRDTVQPVLARLEAEYDRFMAWVRDPDGGGMDDLA